MVMWCDDHEVCDSGDQDNHANIVHDNDDHDVEVADKSRASIAAARCIVVHLLIKVRHVTLNIALR